MNFDQTWHRNAKLTHWRQRGWHKTLCGKLLWPESMWHSGTPAVERPMCCQCVAQKAWKSGKRVYRAPAIVRHTAAKPPRKFTELVRLAQETRRLRAWQEWTNDARRTP